MPIHPRINPFLGEERKHLFWCWIVVGFLTHSKAGNEMDKPSLKNSDFDLASYLKTLPKKTVIEGCKLFERWEKSGTLDFLLNPLESYSLEHLLAWNRLITRWCRIIAYNSRYKPVAFSTKLCYDGFDEAWKNNLTKDDIPEAFLNFDQKVTGMIQQQQ